MNDKTTLEHDLPAVIESAPPAITPMQMLQMAVQQGADIDKLKQLMDLQERWEKNEARKAYLAAMAQFKANPPKIAKDKQVSFIGLKGGLVEYKHATLDQASELVGAALSIVGISHRWEIDHLEDGRIKVSCVLTHVQGHSERVTMPPAIPDITGSKNSIQAIGSTISYMQRYSLFAAVGLAPKEADDDARGREERKMAENVKADFLAAIEALIDKPSGEALWKTIATACQQAGDIPAYDELKRAMTRKMKGLP